MVLVDLCCAGFRQRTSSLHKHSGRRTHRSAVCARRAAAQVAPDTGPSAHAHTPGSRERLPSRELPRRLPLPPATGVEMCFFGKFSNCANRPGPTLAKNLGTRSSWVGLWGVHEQYLSNLWATGHAVLCAWKPERRSFTHSKCHARLLSVRFFRSQSESSRPYVWGVGLTQQIA